MLTKTYQGTSEQQQQQNGSDPISQGFQNRPFSYKQIDVKRIFQKITAVKKKNENNLLKSNLLMESQNNNKEADNSNISTLQQQLIQEDSEEKLSSLTSELKPAEIEMARISGNKGSSEDSSQEDQGAAIEDLLEIKDSLGEENARLLGRNVELYFENSSLSLKFSNQLMLSMIHAAKKLMQFGFFQQSQGTTDKKP